MPLSEFEIISRYFSTQRFPTEGRSDLAVGIGDDAAIVRPEPGTDQVIAIDTIVEGVHFPASMPAWEIGYRALAVNLSDLAAMGARPRWFTLALTLSGVNAAWLEGFADGMAVLAAESGCVLIGGDTTAGPLTITVQVCGDVPRGEALLRSGARAGDLLFVTGTPGIAALGLRDYQAGDQQSPAAQSFRRPVPRVQFGIGLRRVASAAIDVSDGLLADLGHLLTAGNVAAEVDVRALPSTARLQMLGTADAHYLQLAGGDDYELCFTAPVEYADEIAELARLTQTPCQQIGRIVSGRGISLSGTRHNPAELVAAGYEHFRNTP